jgi:hypothetical protein
MQTSLPKLRYDHGLRLSTTQPGQLIYRFSDHILFRVSMVGKVYRSLHLTFDASKINRSKNIIETHGGEIWAKNNDDGKIWVYIYTNRESAITYR